MKTVTEENKMQHKPTPNLVITEAHLRAWLGSDAVLSHYIELILDVANGDYPIEQLREDVLGYEFETGE